MDFFTLARDRYSERYFDARPVERDKLLQILEAGRLCPTAHNNQPQRIYVLESEEALARIRPLTPFHYNAPLLLLVCYDGSVVWHKSDDGLFGDYHSGEQDASIAAATMMYAAEDLGVHSLWIRGFDARALAEACALPESIFPLMLLALGYPSARSHPSRLHSQRIPFEDMFTFL